MSAAQEAEQRRQLASYWARIRELEADVASLHAELASQSRHCPECVRLEAEVDEQTDARNQWRAIAERHEATIAGLLDSPATPPEETPNEEG